MATGNDSPSLFISYRRDDAGGHAGRLSDRLKQRFGEDRVFLDTEKIARGADFARVLEERLAAADVLVAVIGPDWLDAANDRGRRLDQPDDYVRMEIASALAQGKRVVPVLVGGARMPAEAALPAPLKALHRCNAATVSETNYESSFDDLVADLRGQRRGAVRRELDRLKRLLRALRLTSMLVPALALAVVLAVWVGLLAPLNLDAMAHNGLMWAADEMAPLPADPGVLLVAIDETSEAALGPPAFGPSAHWRVLFARLIERARAAGARAVAFDIAFATTTEADATLAAAAHRALAATPPTRVILGGHRLDGDAPALASALRALPWGTTCLQRRGQRYAVPLAILAPDARLEALVPIRRPAFALVAGVAGVALEADLDRRRLRIDGQPSAGAPRFSTIERVSVDLCDTLRAGDDVAALMIRPSARGYWQDAARRVSLAEALDPARTPDARLAGRILLVGDTRAGSDDRHALRRGLSTHTVPGVELHAEAIATLVTRRETVQATVDQSLAWLAGMALLGATGGFFAAPRPPWQRRVLAAGLCLAYVALALALAAGGFVLNLPYDLSAFALAWFVLAHLQRAERIREMPS